MKLELDVDLEQLAQRAADLVLEQLAASAGAGDGLRDVKLLSAEEVAGLVGRSARWVRERKHRGDLPFVQLDSGSMFRVQDVDAFIRARRIGR